MCKSHIRAVPVQARQLDLHSQVAGVTGYEPLVSNSEDLKASGTFGSCTYRQSSTSSLSGTTPGRRVTDTSSWKQAHRSQGRGVRTGEREPRGLEHWQRPLQTPCLLQFALLSTSTLPLQGHGKLILTTERLLTSASNHHITVHRIKNGFEIPFCPLKTEDILPGHKLFLYLHLWQLKAY